MKLTYTHPEHTHIMVELEEGETLGGLVGPHKMPAPANVPCDPLNKEYAAIMRERMAIEPYAPPVTEMER